MQGIEAIRITVQDKSSFIEHSLKTISIGIDSQGIKAIVGKLKEKASYTIQSYVFNKEKWNIEKIKEWSKKNNKHYEWIVSQAKDLTSIGWLMGENKVINLSEGKEYSMKPIAKLYDCELKDFNEKERTFTAVASTESKDRDGDVIRVSGAKLKNFRRNPVILFGHDDRSLPIAKATDIRIEGNKILFKPKFATADMNPFADQVFKMFKGGFMRAFSIRFDPIEFDMIPIDAKDNGSFVRQGREFKKWELLEISAVNIPANPEALKNASYQEFTMKSFVKSHGGSDDDVKLYNKELPNKEISKDLEDREREEEKIKQEEKEKLKFLGTKWDNLDEDKELLDEKTRIIEEKKDKLEFLKMRQKIQQQEKELDDAIKTLEREVEEDEKIELLTKKIVRLHSGITDMLQDKKGGKR